MAKKTKRSELDFYSQKAKKEGYPARSVYKLKEIQEKFHILHRGDMVLDLGAAPGSWSLFAAEKAGPEGKVFGIDLSPISVSDRKGKITWIQGDIFDDSLLGNLPVREFSAVICDAAPATTGNRTIDSARSLDLADRALSIAEQYCMKGGNFAVKLFQGGEEKIFSARVLNHFSQVKRCKPRACRKDSFEIYLIGLGKKEKIRREAP